MDFYYREISFVPASHSFKEPSFLGTRKGGSNIIDVSFAAKANLKIAPPTRYYCDPSLVYSNRDWKNRSVRCAGFKSEGNSCYINAIMSAMLSVPTFSQTLQEHFHECSGHGFCLPCVSSELTKKAFKNATGSIDLKPIALKHLKQIHPDFRPHEQQDAAEFYTAFGARFQNDTLSAYDINGISERTKHTTLFDQVFNGWHKQTIRCSKCGHSSSDNTAFYLLSLPKAKTLSDSLKRAFSPEKIEGRVCPGCKGTSSTLTLSILEEPNCLVLSTNKTLNLTSPEHEITVNEVKYKLTSTIEHHGTALSGHYIANCMNAAGQWMRRNDDEVTNIHPSRVVTPQTVLLFYVKTDIQEQVGNVAEKKNRQETTSFKIKKVDKEKAAQSIQEIFGETEDVHDENEQAKAIESRIRTRSDEWEKDEMDEEYDAPSVKKMRSEMENRHKTTAEMTQRELNKTNRQFFVRQQNPKKMKYSDSRSKFKPRGPHDKGPGGFKKGFQDKGRGGFKKGPNNHSKHNGKK